MELMMEVASAFQMVSIWIVWIVIIEHWGLELWEKMAPGNDKQRKSSETHNRLFTGVYSQ